MFMKLFESVVYVCVCVCVCNMYVCKVELCMGLDVEDLAAKPSRSEVSQALNCLKNGKSPGEDGVQLELLKLGGDTVLECFTYLCGWFDLG